MRYTQRSQERLIIINESSEQNLGMQLSNKHKRHVRETSLHEKMIVIGWGFNHPPCYVSFNLNIMIILE